MKIKVKNFQAIESLDLEIEPGITLISGPNSSGKTALFRAIRAALLNPGSAKSYIRSGEKKCEVALTIGRDENFCVRWTRTSTQAEYEINGETYKKVGRTTVWDRCPGFPLGIDAAGNTLNFQTEWDVLFPFSRSSSDLFALLEEIFDLGDARGVFAAIRSDVQEATREKNALTEPIAKTNRWLNYAVAVPREDVVAKVAKDFSGKLSEMDAAIVLSDRVDAANMEIARYAGLDSIPEMEMDVSRYEPWVRVAKLAETASVEIPDDFVFESSELVDQAMACVRGMKVLAQYNGEIRKAEVELETLQEHLEREFDVCPLCGRSDNN